MNTIDLIMEYAKVPSFSSYEDRLHPSIIEFVGRVEGATLEVVEINNLLVRVPGRPDAAPVAVTAHLDKINHFGAEYPAVLPVRRDHTRLVGQLDDAIGVGICLSVLRQSSVSNFAPLYILLSEMEESYGLRRHPDLLRNGGMGLYPRMGAERLANHILAAGELPSVVLTVDTTPYFRGGPGVALYCRHWELNGLAPSPALVEATRAVEEYFRQAIPRIVLHNNVNDYIKYGDLFNSERVTPIPCIAIEPAIFPYHQRDEGVFARDIIEVEAALISFLQSDKALR